MDGLNPHDTSGSYPGDGTVANDGQVANWNSALAAAKMQAAQVTNDQDQTRDTHNTGNPSDTVLIPSDASHGGRTPPTAAPAQSGFWSTLHFGACVADETALSGLKGLGQGAAAGAAVGFVDGMTGGAIVGSTFAPGPGTIALGGGGAVGGAIAGGTAGGFFGSAVGVAKGAREGWTHCGAAAGTHSDPDSEIPARAVLVQIINRGKGKLDPRIQVSEDLEEWGGARYPTNLAEVIRPQLS